MPRTKRTLGEGLYQDAHGITVLARIGSGAHIREARERFPLVDGDGIPYSKKNNRELIMCRLQLLENLRRARATDGTAAGTLGAAIDAFLLAHPKQAGDDHRKHTDYHYLLAHWRRAPIALLPVNELPRKLIREQLHAWREAGRAPTTVNHRKRALAAVLKDELEDDDADVVLPTDKIANVPPKRLEPRGIAIPIMIRILATMPDRGRPTKGASRAVYSETKIRLRVMAWTGLPRKSLVRLERRHVDFRAGKLFQPPRKKAKGAAGQWVDLLPQALEALRDYDGAGLWQTDFSRSSMWKSWRRAVESTERTLIAEAEKTGDKTMLEQFQTAVPPNCRPYDLRHSFLTEALRQTGDIYAVKGIAQHADIKTTERYLQSAVPERVANAIAKMRAAWCPDSPTKKDDVVRDFQVVSKK